MRSGTKAQSADPQHCPAEPEGLTFMLDGQAAHTITGGLCSLVTFSNMSFRLSMCTCCACVGAPVMGRGCCGVRWSGFSGLGGVQPRLGALACPYAHLHGASRQAGRISRTVFSTTPTQGARLLIRLLISRAAEHSEGWRFARFKAGCWKAGRWKVGARKTFSASVQLCMLHSPSPASHAHLPSFPHLPAVPCLLACKPRCTLSTLPPAPPSPSRRALLAP